MIRNSLSVYRQKLAHQLAQLYSKLMPTPCLLCGANNPHSCLCNACIQNLATFDHVCPRCASPLNQTALCGQCLHSPSEQDASFSLFRYQPPVDCLIA